MTFGQPAPQSPAQPTRLGGHRHTYTHAQKATAMPKTHNVDHLQLLDILEMVARSDIDIADMLAVQHGFNEAEREYVRTGDRAAYDARLDTPDPQTADEFSENGCSSSPCLGCPSCSDPDMPCPACDAPIVGYAQRCPNCMPAYQAAAAREV